MSRSCWWRSSFFARSRFHLFISNAGRGEARQEVGRGRLSASAYRLVGLFFHRFLCRHFLLFAFSSPSLFCMGLTLSRDSRIVPPLSPYYAEESGSRDSSHFVCSLPLEREGSWTPPSRQAPACFHPPTPNLGRLLLFPGVEIHLRGGQPSFRYRLAALPYSYPLLSRCFFFSFTRGVAPSSARFCNTPCAAQGGTRGGF